MAVYLCIGFTIYFCLFVVMFLFVFVFCVLLFLILLCSLMFLYCYFCYYFFFVQSWPLFTRNVFMWPCALSTMMVDAIGFI